MPYVNEVLLSLPDSAFVQGAMTDMDGVFKIVTDVNEGLFKVTSVGYQTLYIKAGQDLTIQMKEDTQLLSEVVVKGQLPKTHVKGDAMRTTVAGTILSCPPHLPHRPRLEVQRGPLEVPRQRRRREAEGTYVVQFITKPYRISQIFGYLVKYVYFCKQVCENGRRLDN